MVVEGPWEFSLDLFPVKGGWRPVDRTADVRAKSCPTSPVVLVGPQVAITTDVAIHLPEHAIRGRCHTDSQWRGGHLLRCHHRLGDMGMALVSVLGYRLDTLGRLFGVGKTRHAKVGR
jgi:hypothetical protein